MNVYFINPPFKAEYGKFSRESRSPAITTSSITHLRIEAGVTGEGVEVLSLNIETELLQWASLPEMLEVVTERNTAFNSWTRLPNN